MMDNKVFTADEINNRVVSMIRQKFSENDEFKLNRIIQGEALAKYTPTLSEQAQIDAFSTLVLSARQAGVDAAADSLLLQSVLDYEVAQVRLAKAPLDPLAYPDVGGINGGKVANPALAIDADERAVAQAVVDGASVAVTDLVTARAVV